MEKATEKATPERGSDVVEYGSLNVQTNYGVSGNLLLVLSLIALQVVKGYGTSIRLFRDCHNESDHCWK